MKVAASFLLAALASVANAIVAFTNSGYDVKAGQPFTLTWAGGVGPVTINLKNGPPTNLQTVSTLTSGQPGEGSFTVTLPATLATDTYAFEIIDGTETNYSPQFQFVGAAPTSTSVSSSSSASSTSSTSSSSSTSSVRASTTSSSAPSTTTSSVPTTTPPNPNSAPRYGSPLALILVTVAALVYFN